MKANSYLAESRLVNFSHPDIQSLISQRGWKNLSEFHKIGAAYQFVKDEIVFGYNKTDDLKAHKVLADGYGQCNTKATLLMALLRALGIPCRFHGFTIFNQLQKGAIPEYLFFLAPDVIIHSWVEVHYKGEWLDLEGFIIDQAFLASVQSRFSDCNGPFSGFGIATQCLLKPQVNWEGRSTYIQKEGIKDDFGVFAHPDTFYEQYGTNLKGIKRFLFRYIIRHLMNWNVRKIRAQLPKKRHQPTPPVSG